MTFIPFPPKIIGDDEAKNQFSNQFYRDKKPFCLKSRKTEPQRIIGLFTIFSRPKALRSGEGRVVRNGSCAAPCDAQIGLDQAEVGSAFGEISA